MMHRATGPSQARSGRICLNRCSLIPGSRSRPRKARAKMTSTWRGWHRIPAKREAPAGMRTYRPLSLELTAAGISAEVLARAPETDEILVCGGGIHNTALVQRLRALLPGMAVKSTGDYGINPDAVEAVTFAWLARQRLENIPANLPSVTGARGTRCSWRCIRTR